MSNIPEAIISLLPVFYDFYGYVIFRFAQVLPCLECGDSFLPNFTDDGHAVLIPKPV